MAKQKTKILIIDDDPEVLMQTARILNSNDFSVWQTDSVNEAWEMLNQKPDIVLLDIVMPDKNGFEFCQEIKAVPEFNDCFVILVSGVRVSAEDQTKGLNLGADGFITRPCTQDELLAKINAYKRIHSQLAKIRNSEKWLETTLKSMNDGVIVTDNASNILFMNNSAVNILHTSLVEAIDRQVDYILILRDKDTGTKFQNLAAELLKNKVKMR